jgi:hypothetical protein
MRRGIARSMFQIMVRSSGGSLGKGEKTTGGEHGVVVVIVETGGSNDGRAEDRVDESNTSDMLFWTSALWLGVSGVLL